MLFRYFLEVKQELSLCLCTFLNHSSCNTGNNKAVKDLLVSIKRQKRDVHHFLNLTVLYCIAVHEDIFSSKINKRLFSVATGVPLVYFSCFWTLDVNNNNLNVFRRNKKRDSCLRSLSFYTPFKYFFKQPQNRSSQHHDPQIFKNCNIGPDVFFF